MDLKSVLFDLCRADGVSGDETSASSVALRELKKFTDEAFSGDFGNVFAKIDNKRNKTILLDAHIDQVGFIVNYITDEGFLKFSPVGGIDKRLLPATKVEVLTADGKLEGVITSCPPHLSKDSDKAPSYDELYIDVGLGKDETMAKIPLGSRVIFKAEPTTLLGDRVSSRALDDRAGVATILRALELVGTSSEYNIDVAFSCQEETGESGAKMLSFKSDCDLAIAVDVSFAYSKGEDKEKCGEMGKGAMIGIAPSLSKDFSNALIRLAKENNLPYQLEVMSSQTGTDADAIGVSKGGVKSVTLSIPLKYMHTPVEVVSLSDIENTALLISEFLKAGELL
ncbi:MAG: M20/M25/M40 family metallo-hydrolase [Ruminococcus sp.]|nr:M20/M25/M40 family metallo-hydrolase [Ruminococcus sp.]